MGALPPQIRAHEQDRPSVHDVAAAVLDRLALSPPEAQAAAQSLPGMLKFLRPDEVETLSTAHLRFAVNVPVQVTVFRDARQTNEPFWLEARSFKPTGAVLKVGKDTFDGWERPFPAGEIGLGVNSLQSGGLHYLIAVRPQKPGARLRIDSLYPRQLRLADWAVGAQPYVDRDDRVTELPPGLPGQRLLRTEHRRRGDGQLLNVLRKTPFASSEQPDPVVLTWSGDPRTTQAIQWRTSPRVPLGWVDYWRVGADASVTSATNRVPARRASIADKRLVNDREIAWHTAELTGLDPGATYAYRVGSVLPNGTSAPGTFTTAPAGAEPFSFVYMGDAQNGLDQWGALVHRAHRDHPEAAFFLMAGDLVNRGAERDDWDAFFHFSRGVFDRRPVVPVIGNHECQGGHPTLYLKQFALPLNGPPTIESERAYAFEYGPALFVILDSNLDPKRQKPWLEAQLAQTKARWKFVAYHHPAYSSAPGRSNSAIRKAWTPLFDKYHVDLALQGHDHAYLRTHPLKGNQRVPSAAQGTTYVVSVSGTKMYDQAKHDYTAVGFTKVSTYQVLDIQIAGDRLRYRAYDDQGRLRDELVIEK